LVNPPIENSLAKSSEWNLRVFVQALSKLSSIILPSGNCITGTVPLGEMSSNCGGLLRKTTSRNSIEIAELAMASLARMA
jgi:hypothetical protein